MAQIAYPDGDITVSNFTPTPSTPTTLWDKIDEVTASDSDYITSLANQVATAEVSTTNVSDPSSSTGHRVWWRGRVNATNKGLNLTVSLYQGTTLIASAAYDNTTLTASFADYYFDLTGTEADSITDYTDLRIRFYVSYATAGNFFETSWSNFECPDATGTQYITSAGAIASAEAFGSPTLDMNVSGAGNIASAEAFGTPTIIYTQYISGAGAIASGEAFGTNGAWQSFYEHFPGSSLDSDYWASVTSGGGSVTVTDSYVKMARTSATDVAYVYYKKELDKTKSQLWVINGNVVDAEAMWSAIVRNTSSPGTAIGGGTYSDFVIRLSVALDTGEYYQLLEYWDSSNNRQIWNPSTNSWSTTPYYGTLNRIHLDNYSEVGIEFDAEGSNSRFRLLAWTVAGGGSKTYDQGGPRLMQLTDWVNWTGVQTSQNDLYLFLGTPINSTYTSNDIRIEYVHFENGPREVIYLNGQATQGSGYDIYRGWTYGRRVVNCDRTTVDLTQGASGWDSVVVKDPMVVRDGSSYYMFYSGYNNSNYQIGLATSSDGENWSRYGSNPIIAYSAPSENHVFFPYVVKDVLESDSNKRWKMLYVCVNSGDGKRYIRSAYASSPDSTWTKAGVVLSPGGSGAWDEAAVFCPVPYWYNNQWEVWYGGSPDDGDNEIGRAYGSSLLSTLTKDAGNPKFSIASDAEEFLNATMTTRVGSVSSTTGFRVNAIVALDDDTDASFGNVNRIRKIVTDTSIEFYHEVDGFGTSCNIRQQDAFRRHYPRHIRRHDGLWEIWGVSFAPYIDEPSITWAIEQNAIWTHTGTGGPDSGTYTHNDVLNPGVTLDDFNCAISYENISFTTLPVYTSLSITGAGGIASAEAFGTPTVTMTQNISNAGAIASAEAFGSPTLDMNITGAGTIASAETFGSPTLDMNVTGAGGITSTEAFGSSTLDMNITGAGGIASAEAFGTPDVISGIQFINRTQDYVDWGTEITLNKPTGTASGDVLIGIIGVAAGVGASTPTCSDFTYVCSDNNSDIGIWVFRRVCGESEPSSYTWDITESVANVSGAILCYRGVETSDPINAFDENLGSGTNLVAPSITTTVDNTRVIACYAQDDGYGYSITLHASLTERHQICGTTQLGDCRSASGDFTKESAGSTGTITSTSGNSGYWATATLALTPLGAEFNITNAGNIASAEAFGSPTLDMNITGAGAIGSVEAFGSPALDMNITGAGGIASLEAFGTPNVTGASATEAQVSWVQFRLPFTGVQTVYPSSIASAEAFGTPTITYEQDISSAGAIASAEAFGTPQLDLNVTSAGGIASAEAFGLPALSMNITSAGGIASLEAFGSPQLDLNITGAGGIASAEAFGSAALSLNITGAGDISSLEAFGTPVLSWELFITDAGGIASAEAFGSPTLSMNISSAGGIASAEAFGTPQLDMNVVSAGGIASAEAFGTPEVTTAGWITNAGNIASLEAFGTPTVTYEQDISSAGAIPSAEAFGTPQLNLNITGAGGVASLEAFGTPQLDLNITSAGGIASAEAFGSPSLSLNITAAGDIASAEAFGAPVLSWELFITDAGAIASAEAFGTPALALNITSAGGIASAEAFGSPQLDLNITSAGGIASAEAFGSPNVTQGGAPQNITGAGAIASLEAFGTPKLSLNITSAGAIPSAEAFGSPRVDMNIAGAGGIASLEAFGTAQLNLNITSAGGIISAEAFGTPAVSFEQFITDAGAIASLEAFGTPQVNLSIAGAGGVASLEAFGSPTLDMNIAGAGGIASAEAFGTAVFKAVAKPDGDISLGQWTDELGGTTNIYTSIDESIPNDVDFIQTDISGTTSTYVGTLSDVGDPDIHTGHMVYYRYRKYQATGITAQLVVRLMQGAVEIASWTHPNVGESWTDAVQTLTEEQAGNITNYSDLRVKFEAVEV